MNDEEDELDEDDLRGGKTSRASKIASGVAHCSESFFGRRS